MAGVDLFAPQSEEAIKAGLRLAKKQAKARSNEAFELAVDYIDDRQISDVEAQLSQRYGTTWGDVTTRIHPVAVPLVHRFVSEQATAYNKPIKRELVNETGEVQEDATEALHRYLSDSSYDEYMHRLDQYVLAMKVCGLWYQSKRGMLRPTITFPHYLYPVPPEDDPLMNPADQNDYLGHIVQLNWASEDYSQAVGNVYAFLHRAGTLVYQSQDPYELGDILSETDNPYKWRQVADDGKGGGTEKDAPLQMLTYWHRVLPVKDLIPDADHDLVMLNREINVQLSVLMHTARTQGWSQLFIKLMDAKNAPRQMAYGAQMAIPLEVGESADVVTMPNDYLGLVQMLLTVVKMAAIAYRLSPSDFAIEGAAPASGFAKLIDSLPKLQARDERLRRLKAAEENLAWPRIAAIGKAHGHLPAGVERLRMRVTFPEVEFPETATETVARQSHDFQHGLSTPALELAKREGITEEEAQEKIAERKATQPKPPADDMQQRPGIGASRFGALIARPTATPKREEPEEDEE